MYQTSIEKIELANLLGSEKQIEWAKTIRKKFISKLDNAFRNGLMGYKKEWEIVGKKEYIEILLTIEEAKFWIDERDNNELGIILRGLKFLNREKEIAHIQELAK